MKHLKTICLVFAAGTVLVPGAGAQGPQSGPMPAAAQKNMKAWETWRQKHKNITALEQTVRGLSLMEQDAKTKLTKEQAKAIYPALKKWRSKKTMTDAEAKACNKFITGRLSTAQLKKVASTARPGPGGPGGPPPGGMGGPPPNGMGGPPPNGMGGPPPPAMSGPPPGGQGGPPPGGAPKQMPAPKEYNPLNPDTLPFPPERQRAKPAMDNLLRNLGNRAK
ncbi:MAG TPA: hypothetical protein PKK84_03650 [Armatimonadota bacterium]|nr:hypothetical protein [Armatimonadota bacterium]